MAEWWQSLTVFQSVLFVIGCATTLFMIIQIIMLAVSGGADDPSFDGPDSVESGADMPDGDVINDAAGGGFTVFGLKIVSVRSIIAFFAIGSWIAFSLEFVMPWWGALLIGIAAGLLAAFAVAYLMHNIYKLQGNGNIEIANAVGKIADVYLTIPASGMGSGKISVVIQERLVEFGALNSTATPIKTGDKVKIVSKVDDGTVMVEPLELAKQDSKTE